jgi:hypothetical protein
MTVGSTTNAPNIPMKAAIATSSIDVTPVCTLVFRRIAKAYFAAVSSLFRLCFLFLTGRRAE